MSSFAGSEHSLMSFGVTHNPRNIIAPGQTLQVSRYIYLYEDRKPVVTSSFFPGYTIAKEKTAGKKKAEPKPQQQAKPKPQQQAKKKPVKKASKPAKRAKIVAAERWMRARTEVNFRTGPGTTYRRIGLLRAGQKVRVTGEAGAWLRIEKPGGGPAFVHGSLLVGLAAQGRDAAALSPKCAGMGKGAECWKETANRRGCYVWDTYLRHDQTVTWSGVCANGIAAGRGTLVWTRQGKSGGEGTGTLARGKKHGRWVLRFPNGVVAEGPYVNGKGQGRWVFRTASGQVDKGPYVNGRKHGRWVIRQTNGLALEGPYVNGKRHGRWVWRYSDGLCRAAQFHQGKVQKSSKC